MSIFDMFRVNAIKNELAVVTRERDALQKLMAETGRLELHEIRESISDARQTKLTLQAEAQKLKEEITQKKNELIVLDEALLLQSFGLYRPKYDLQNSAAYKTKLESIQAQQETLVKGGKAAFCKQTWRVNDSEKEGERMTRDYLKLILRSFNNECDASITKVKFNNIESIEKKIVKAFEVLNKLGARMQMEITKDYLDLKLEELHLVYEYQVKKQQEKEEQKRIREQMREEARLLREVEEARQSLEKEEKHFNKAIQDFDKRLAHATTDAERQVLTEERQAVQQRLVELQEKKRDIDYREQNTRAGYVYIVSNLGAFGENIYKIGVTRRLDPVERVDELGDASVPFEFDIHALIFSDDAPALENALHKAFDGRRLNLINRRKEFFHVSLDEVSEVVRSNFNKPVEFTLLAEAAEYRQTQAMKESKITALPAAA